MRMEVRCVSHSVLIVDDSESVRGLLRMILQGAGFECLVASNGAEALGHLDQRTVDLVLSDLWMDGMNGLQLVEAIRADEINRHLPILILTTDQSPERRWELRSAGATGVLYKPIPPKELVGCVLRLLRDAR